ncbi:MAG: sarcosine oxidase subunit alpha family protein [Beijerinckiaceae bacterium]
MNKPTSFAAPVTGQPSRMPRGGYIDRTQPLSFTFDGGTYSGFAGDTLASALLANGVRLFGRSFKYHRPRGLLAAGSEEPNALVELRNGARREPNTRATMVELYAGLEAASQNRWPTLGFDLRAVTSLASPMLAAGFYYKTFMWPPSFWEKVYEPAIRRAAGLGRAAGAADPDHYEQATAFCDLLVIGGGPAGLAAALAAARSGARVILCDEDFRLGGRLLTEQRRIGDTSSTAWLAAGLAELASLPDVRLMPRTTVFGAYDQGTYGAIERVGDHLQVPERSAPRQRYWRIIAPRSILAAGAIERPVVFAGNDRPGVMLAGAVRAYVNRYGVLPGRRAVVFTTCGDGWRTAADLAAAGAEVAAVVEARPHVAPTHAALASASGIRVIAGGRVIATRGTKQITAVEIQTSDSRTERIACDLLAVANGWNPTLHLTSHLGGKPVWDTAISAFVPGKLPPGMAAVGAAAGHLTLAQALAGGAQSGIAAARACGFDGADLPAPATDPEDSDGTPIWQVIGGRGKAFVDFQNDVTRADVELARREGYGAVEHLKRYTTLGMGTDQGKTANLSGLALMAELTGRHITDVGITVTRPPYTPVAIGALAGIHRGRHFRPTRLAPSHRWAEKQGAVFTEAGAWMRAQYYPRSGETTWRETVDREVRSTRSAVGVCDVSTLGKIDIQGADAALFLDRIYCNTLSSLAIGRARYGLMLREDGFIMDDGTTARLGNDHFVMSTTTVNAAKVLQHLDYCHQVLWPSLDVQMVSVTEQWAQFSVAGPKARDVLRGVVDAEHDVSDVAFPFLAASEISVGGGIGARLFRISFSGERAYELAVPASYGEAAISAIMAAGAPFGITAYGTEALGIMRIEKGHVAGNEINGQTTAHDLGLGRMLSKKKDYIGRLMAERPALIDPERPRFVGFKPVDIAAGLTAGAHFLARGAPSSANCDEGYMTSVAISPTLGHTIGLGLLRRGPERIGEHIRAVDLVRGLDVEVEICDPVFVDPEGVRAHG